MIEPRIGEDSAVPLHPQLAGLLEAWEAELPGIGAAVRQTLVGMDGAWAARGAGRDWVAPPSSLLVALGLAADTFEAMVRRRHARGAQTQPWWRLWAGSGLPQSERLRIQRARAQARQAVRRLPGAEALAPWHRAPGASD